MALISACSGYERPPVSEVALSIEFSPLQDWHSSDGALFWSSVQTDYPLMESMPPLFPTSETFDGVLQTLQATPSMQFVGVDASRNWLIGTENTWLIQIQRDRFVLNWRKRIGDEKYPRYLEALRPRFQREWNRFKEFVRNKSLGNISVRLCEVTYVNDMIRGKDWETISEAASLLAQFSGKGSTGYLPDLETLSINGTFRFSDPPGRLHFSTQHLLRQMDKREVLQLSLTARNAPDTSEDVDILSCLDVGRERVVEGFTDLISTKAQGLWGRTK